MAKSQILVIYGEDHPLYSITLTGLLDELSMYERLKGLKPSNSKSSCPTKKYHKQELTISKEVNDRTSEAATHGNLAVAFQALGKHEMALVHYLSHLNIARELKDVAGELPIHFLC